jgi:hypothetical protein
MSTSGLAKRRRKRSHAGLRPETVAFFTDDYSKPVGGFDVLITAALTVQSSALVPGKVGRVSLIDYSSCSLGVHRR